MEIILAEDGSFYYSIHGIAEGTSYSIVYQDEEDRDFQPGIEDLLAVFEKSLSVYDNSSIISRINRNEDVEVDDYFLEVFTKAKEISSLTEGAFDISAEPLFKAWGFSSENKNIPNKDQINDLRKIIGMDKVRIENRKVIKSDPCIVLNANAIAKGYSADIVASFLDRCKCSNYLIEIGGEIRVSGKNPEGDAWRIGIDRPSENNPIPGQDIMAVLQITDRGIATSGNYRQFYIEDGKKISHTIDPSSGYPTNHNLLSVTVIADDALTADAFATAFMVAGIDKSMMWLKQLPSIDAIFICDMNGEYELYYSARIKKNISYE